MFFLNSDALLSISGVPWARREGVGAADVEKGPQRKYF